MAKIAAICISDVRGIQKHEIPEAFLKKDWGIEGDAHAGNWHRQVSLLSVDSVAKLQEKLSFELKHGAFAENILVEGMANDCAIRKAAGDCVMPREGIFVKVLESGEIKTGDEIEIVK